METQDINSHQTRVLVKHGRPVMACLCVVAVLMVGCSGSSSSAINNPVSGGQGGGDGRLPSALIDLRDDSDAGLLVDIPEVVASEVMAATGIQVAYTSVEQQEVVEGSFVELQWQYMQSCLERLTVVPLVLVRGAGVEPFTVDDDVIHNIEGIPVASSSMRLTPVIQIVAADFDGSLGNEGFYLRSIMGRLLWISAGLAERDYPFNCARQQPGEE